MFRSWRALCVVFAVAACGDPAATEADGDDADTQAPSDSASDAASDLVSSPDVVDAELVDADLGDSSAGDTADGAQSDSTDAADAGVADAGPSDTAADSSSDAAATGTDTAPGLDADASPAVDTADTTSGLDADTSPTVDTGPACGTTCELLDRDGAYLLRQTAAGAAEELNDDFGAALATADLDADGLADLVIGGPGENGDAGVVFVFRGAAGGLTDGALYLASTLGLTDEPGARLGTALAAGDINGDGRDDVVAGAPGAGGGAGAVVVSLALSNGSLGPGTRLQQPDLSCGNAEAGDAFGEAVAVGDVNGDGFADVVAAAPGENSAAGVVCLAFGSATGLVASGGVYFQDSHGYVSAAQEAGDRFGHALALADVDGDGLADLAAGAPGEDLVGIGSDAGLVTVWFGKAGADATDAFSAGVRVDQTDAGAAEEPGDRYGSALASVGGDNLFRLAASAPDETVGSNQSGNVIAFETVTPAEVSGTSLAPVADPLGAFDTGDRFGASLALGDLNGDGWLDLAAGAPGASQGAGRVTVFQGHPTGLQAGQSVNQSALVGGNEAGDLLGASLAAGDFDGDGAADLAIGAPGEAPFASPTSGLVTVVAGALSLPHVSHGPFVGGISDTSVHVWIRGSQPAPWRVELWPSAAPSQVQTQTGPALAQASDFTGRVVASGLTPDTAYSYRVVFDGDVGATTSFRTLPAAGSASQIRFLFAADFHVNLKPFSIFETMAGLAPDFIIMGGDNIYADSPNTVPDTPEGYFGRYRATFGDGRLSDALASTPVFMTWDDHEIINDFYPTKSPRYPSARAGFDAYQAVHNPAPAVAGELYYAFQAGPADFFVLDTRTHRDANTEPDGPTKTMLGLTQRQALLSWLDTSTATFKVIVSSVPFSDWSTTKSDSWNGFDNAGKNFSSERALIFNHIDTNDISGVLLVSGDQHWSGVFQHTAGSTTLHEFMPTPAAIGNRALPAGITTAPDVLHASDSHRVFGRFDLDDSGASPTAHFRLVSDSGQVLYSLVLSASDLGL